MGSSLTKAEEPKVRLDYEQSFDGVKPDVKSEWGKHGEYALVGNGKVTNPDTCGKFRGFWGCSNRAS